VNVKRLREPVHRTQGSIQLPEPMAASTPPSSKSGLPPTNKGSADPNATPEEYVKARAPRKMGSRLTGKSYDLDRSTSYAVDTAAQGKVHPMDSLGDGNELYHLNVICKGLLNRKPPGDCFEARKHLSSWHSLNSLNCDPVMMMFISATEKPSASGAWDFPDEPLSFSDIILFDINPLFIKSFIVGDACQRKLRIRVSDTDANEPDNQELWEAIGDVDFMIQDILSEPQQRLVTQLRPLSRDGQEQTKPEILSGHGTIEIYASRVCPDHNQPNRAILVDINFDELDLLDSAQFWFLRVSYLHKASGVFIPFLNTWVSPKVVRPRWSNVIIKGKELHDQDILDEHMRFELYLWNPDESHELVGNADGVLKQAWEAAVQWPVLTNGATVGHCHVKAVEATEKMLQQAEYDAANCPSEHKGKSKFGDGLFSGWFGGSGKS